MENISYRQVAQEGLFTKKKSVEDLLATAQKKISKMKTAEEVDSKLQAVNDSGKAVNAALRTMSDAAKKRASGKIDDKSFKSEIAQASKSIASPIKALYAKLGNVVESKTSVTSDEIKAFQSYLSGLKKLLTARKKALKASPAKESVEYTGDPGLDQVLEELDAMLEDEAMEGCKPKKKKKCKATEGCKATESDDEECDDSECDYDDSEDDEPEDDEEDDEEDEDDDDAEEGCGESLTFSSDELEDYSCACEGMINSDFEDSDSILDEDGSLIF